MSNGFILPIERILSGATILGQSGHGSDDNEGGTPHSPKFQHYWSFIIRLFRVISETLVGVWVLPLYTDAVDVTYNSSWQGLSPLSKEKNNGHPCKSGIWWQQNHSFLEFLNQWVAPCSSDNDWISSIQYYYTILSHDIIIRYYYTVLLHNTFLQTNVPRIWHASQRLKNWLTKRKIDHTPLCMLLQHSLPGDLTTILVHANRSSLSSLTFAGIRKQYYEGLQM